MLSIGRARHPGPCNPSNPSGCSIEFLNVGGWLSGGDLALESKALFLAVAQQGSKRYCSAPYCSSFFSLGTFLSGRYCWWPSRGGRQQSPWRTPFSSHSLRSLFQGVLSYGSCYESCPPFRQRGYRPSVRHLWISRGRERPGEASTFRTSLCCCFQLTLRCSVPVSLSFLLAPFSG